MPYKGVIITFIRNISITSYGIGIILCHTGVSFVNFLAGFFSIIDGFVCPYFISITVFTGKIKGPARHQTFRVSVDETKYSVR
jgi:hypothetical protein